MKKTDNISYRQKSPVELEKNFSSISKRNWWKINPNFLPAIKRHVYFKKIKYEFHLFQLLITENGK